MNPTEPLRQGPAEVPLSTLEKEIPKNLDVKEKTTLETNKDKEEKAKVEETINFEPVPEMVIEEPKEAIAEEKISKDGEQIDVSSETNTPEQAFRLAQEINALQE